MKCDVQLNIVSLENFKMFRETLLATFTACVACKFIVGMDWFYHMSVATHFELIDLSLKDEQPTRLLKLKSKTGSVVRYLAGQDSLILACATAFVVLRMFDDVC